MESSGDPIRVVHSKSHLPAFTPRAILTGFFLIILLSIVTPYTDLVMQGTLIAYNSLPVGVVFLFFVLIVGVNTGLYAIRPSLAFNRNELLLIICMMLICAVIPACGLTTWLITITPAPFYFATPENRWAALFHKYIPQWFRVSDPKAVRWFYEGLPGGTAVPYAAWVKPLIAWSFFAILFFLSYFCLAVIIRHWWMDAERLSFPVAEVPLSIVEDEDHPRAGVGFFGNKLMWIGFFIPVILHTLNSFHLFFPSVPQIQLSRIPIGQGVQDVAPWNVFKELTIWVYFSVIGITYLLSSEVSFSLWFFYLFQFLQRFAFASFGITDQGMYSGGFTPSRFIVDQMVGGYFALTFFLFWTMRKPMVTAIRKSFHKQNPGDAEEAMPIRWALIGWVGCYLLMGLWSVSMGAKFWAAILNLLIYNVIILALSRTVAAGGLMYIDSPIVPGDMMTHTIGAGPIGPASFTVIAYQQMIFMWDQRAALLPNALNTFKIGKSSEISLRKLAPLMGLAVIIAMVISYFANLTAVYHHGAITMHPYYMREGAQWTFLRLQDILTNKPGTQPVEIVCMIFGGLFMAFLLYMNRSFLWWRLSPLGYFMSLTFAMEHLWFSILIGWMISGVIRRYGGIRVYRKMKPAFLGMILGEFVIAGLWVVIDLCFGIRMHDIYPVE